MSLLRFRNSNTRTRSGGVHVWRRKSEVVQEGLFHRGRLFEIKRLSVRLTSIQPICREYKQLAQLRGPTCSLCSGADIIHH